MTEVNLSSVVIDDHPFGSEVIAELRIAVVSFEINLSRFCLSLKILSGSEENTESLPGESKPVGVTGDDKLVINLVPAL